MLDNRNVKQMNIIELDNESTPSQLGIKLKLNGESMSRILAQSCFFFSCQDRDTFL